MIFKNLQGCLVILHKTLSSSTANFDPGFSDVNRKDSTSDGGKVDSRSTLAIIPSVQWALGSPGIPPKIGSDLTVSFLTHAAPYVLQPFSAFLRKGYDLTME